MKTPRQLVTIAGGIALAAVGLSIAQPITTYANRAYGAHPTQKVDVYVPSSASAASPVGVVFWFHGDGWGNGTKRLDTNAYQLRLPKRYGLALASCDYRGETTAVFPAGLIDAENCVRYVQANAAQFKINPNAIGLWGGSHGAFLVDWMLVLCGDTAYTGQPGACPKATVSLFGAPDLPHFASDLAANRATNGCPPPDTLHVVVPPDLASQLYASSIVRAPAASAPSWHLHGTSDCKTPWEGSFRMDSALWMAGKASYFRAYPGFTHGGAQWKVDSVVNPQLRFFRGNVK